VETNEQSQHLSSRRSFLLKGGAAVGAASLGAGGLLLEPSEALAKKGGLTKGDAAILRFLAAAEILETDIWQQYNELAGIQDAEVPGGSGNPDYTEAVAVLDEDMDQYIHDNTDDEISHAAFINAYLAAHGAETVNLDKFRTLPSSQATGAQQIGRLTNLMQLTINTSFWTRYRSDSLNPDFGDVLPNAVPGLATGQHPAIPRTDADLAPPDHLQAIANTAGFHFAWIEQGGTSLYAELAQRVTHNEVLRILLSIGGTEIILIMPEPTIFLDRKFPIVSIIRPTETDGAAMGALNAFTADGLFIGQSPEFFAAAAGLAKAADAARHGKDD